MHEVAVLLFAALQRLLCLFQSGNIGAHAQHVHRAVGQMQGALHGLVPFHCAIGHGEAVFRHQLSIFRQHLEVDRCPLGGFLGLHAAGGRSVGKATLAEELESAVLEKELTVLISHENQTGSGVKYLLREGLLHGQGPVGVLSIGHIETVGDEPQ